MPPHGKQDGFAGLIQEITHSSGIDGPGGLSGDFLLVAENTAMGATLVWNEDGHD
ncbi:hypothetical protein LDC_0798 [sediment metagenome]|uniref:Uncharacterized protein n=1 Tax=sediment metagenome TaxID=749907 RepID=D9PH02_9ZZZZ